MIYSDKQRRISAREVERLKEALLASEERAVEAWLRDLETDAIRSEIERLEADISDYDMLKAGEIAFAKSFALESLPSIFVQARIAAGMSQTSLAQALEVKPQQIQRYEASGYRGASLARLIEVSRVLGVQTEGLFGSEQAGQGGVFSWEKAEEIEWRRFPIKEMVKRRWFHVTIGGDVVQDVKDYFRETAGPQFATALHRKKSRGDTSPNEYALLAWQARVLERARHTVRHKDLPSFQLDDRWLPDLVALTRRPGGPGEAAELLASHGIPMVTERELPGTYLDGAAMLDENGHPVVGLTLRFDRLDNFWFVLFHELGHIFLHLMGGARYDFFDEDETAAGDRFEREADAFALNNLIPEESWNGCLSRFAVTEKAVRLDAERLGIDASIIAGRIRRERGNYTVLSNLVGQDHVRAQFATDVDAAG